MCIDAPLFKKYLHDKNTFSTPKKTRIFVIKIVELKKNQAEVDITGKGLDRHPHPRHHPGLFPFV